MNFKNKENFFLFVKGKIEELENSEFESPRINENDVILNPKMVFILEKGYELIRIDIAKYEGKYCTAHNFRYSQGGTGGGVSTKWGLYDSIKEAIDHEVEQISKFKMRGYEADLYSPELRNIVDFAGEYSEQKDALQTLF